MRSREGGTLTQYAPSVNPFQQPRWSGASPDETEEEAHARVLAMQQAVKTSKEIDAWLLEGKKAFERRKKAVKILLLGQSESGKVRPSYFQLAFAPSHFERERSVWRIVVQLNVIGCMKTVLDALQDEYETNGTHPSNPIEETSKAPLRALRRLRLSLSPLFFIESNLLKILAPECDDCRNMTVRAGAGWKALLQAKTSPFIPSSAKGSSTRPSSVQGLIRQEYDPTSVLAAQRSDIVALWKDPEVQEILTRRRPRLIGSSSYFMNDIERIANLDYVPTDSDIIRARMKTMGVEEHHFIMEKGTSEFYITDVGGTRSQRATWAPFFDDVQCILFLAPLAFDEVLEEDSKVNRLEDSLYLWRDICANKLLAKCHLILFFNKRDVLQATLARGVQVKKYVPTYGDNANDVTAVTKYFREKFKYYHKKTSIQSRPFMCHETSAIDIKSMSVLLTGVRESILRQSLREGDIM
ncbi:heterotrimeric GTP-binding alpha subunit [Crepidotus variabilis]|uniref:Heterotrimeric GTP-binding alpha subunit n=1 Tax=Crepidotus variabilis TaxID=179855 RepID=A0A9P6JRH0_9AGAR|nr:heterotrimeric GTP-binding alpha subunit [Crepidotus variabilis]